LPPRQGDDHIGKGNMVDDVGYRWPLHKYKYKYKKILTKYIYKYYIQMLYTNAIYKKI